MNSAFDSLVQPLHDELGGNGGGHGKPAELQHSHEQPRHQVAACGSEHRCADARKAAGPSASPASRERSNRKRSKAGPQPGARAGTRPRRRGREWCPPSPGKMPPRGKSRRKRERCCDTKGRALPEGQEPRSGHSWAHGKPWVLIVNVDVWCPKSRPIINHPLASCRI